MLRRIRWIVVWLISALLLFLVVGVLLTRGQSVPPGISHTGPAYPLRQARLLLDTTYIDGHSGERRSEQMIFDAQLALIERARELIVIDMFLFNQFHGQEQAALRDVTAQLTSALVAARARQPSLRVIFITDPINTVYGGLRSPQLQALSQAGVEVVVTDLTALPDSNRSYSGWWRLLLQPLGNAADAGWLANVLGEGKVTLRSYLALLNFKANHRKTLVADDGNGGLAAIVSSANPHTASSAHSNIALQFAGAAAADVLRTEQAVLDFSAVEVQIPARWLAMAAESVDAATQDATIRIVTEQQIKRAVLASLSGIGAGDSVRLGMFYLAERDIIEALIAARTRGAHVQVLLDPNKDAFGRSKNGIPARPVAVELHAAGIEVRWCNTHGEQCHFKVMQVDERAAGRSIAILGSANFTRRNLQDFNLETNVLVSMPMDQQLAGQLRNWFDGLWQNQNGRAFSVEYATYARTSFWMRWQYRIMEATGWSSF